MPDRHSAALAHSATSAQDALGREFIRHAKLLNLVRHEMGAIGPRGLDPAALGLLATLVHHGARRQGELAEAALLDPSTVSRYSAQLVRAGLVERRPDPHDGRAVHLIATVDGERLGEQLAARRRHVVQQVLQDWSDTDVATLTELMQRLNDSLDRLRTGTTTAKESSH